MDGWLGEDRMRELIEAPSFTCHKTTNRAKGRLQCAGHMLLLGKGNQFVEVAALLNVDLKLVGEDLIFDSAEDCIEHHKKARTVR